MLLLLVLQASNHDKDIYYTSSPWNKRVPLTVALTTLYSQREQHIEKHQVNLQDKYVLANDNQFVTLFLCGASFCVNVYL